MNEILARHMHNLMLMRVALEEGSINRAAAVLSVSQSTITRGITRLERALGCRLVDRTAQGVRATAFGSLVLDNVKAATDELTIASAKLRNAQRNRHGRIDCGGSTSSMSGFVPLVMKELLKLYPNLEIHIHEGQAASLLKKVYVGELDIAVAADLADKIPKGVKAVELIHHDSMGVFASSDHEVLKIDGPYRMANLLAEENWVFPEPLWPYPRARLGEVLAIAGRSIRTHSSQALRWFVKDGGYLGISTRLMMQSELMASTVVQLETDWQFPKTHHVVYYQDLPELQRPVQAAIDLMMSAARAGEWKHDDF